MKRLLSVLFALCVAFPALADGFTFGDDTGFRSVRSPSAASKYVADAADFDGTNDSLNRGAEFTGDADGKAGTVSFWFDLEGGDLAAMRFRAGAAAQEFKFSVGRSVANLVSITMQNATGTTLWTGTTTATFEAATGWTHFIASWNLATPVAYLYINDVQDQTDVVGPTDGTIDYASGGGGQLVGGDSGGADELNGCLFDYWESRTFLDISVEANRRKFRSAAGKPVNLGSDGSTPTGTAPLVFLHLDDGEAAANFAVNAGTGEGMTVVGALATCASSPTD